MTKGSSLLEPGQKVTKPNVDDRIAAQLVRDLYGLEASGIKVDNKVSKVWSPKLIHPIPLRSSTATMTRMFSSKRTMFMTMRISTISALMDTCSRQGEIKGQTKNTTDHT